MKGLDDAHPFTAVARWHAVLVPFSTNGKGPRRSLAQSSVLHIVGATEFVSSAGEGGILVACYGLRPCRVGATVSSGGTQIATARPQTLGVGELGYVRFQLTPTGKSRLASAPGNQLAAKVTLTAQGHTATGHVALVGYQ